MALLHRLAASENEIEINADVTRADLDALLGFKTGANAPWPAPAI